MAPAFCPATLNETSWLASGVPMPLVTWAVTVWSVPAGFVAFAGVSEMLPETQCFWTVAERSVPPPSVKLAVIPSTPAPLVSC